MVREETLQVSGRLDAQDDVGRQLGLVLQQSVDHLVAHDLFVDRVGFHMLVVEALGRERVELHRREELYRGGRPGPRIGGRTVILVDDGLATGLTARVALRHLRLRAPGRLALAVPVGAPGSADRLRPEADDVLCLHQPAGFRAVGEWYDDFGQVEDEEVLTVLRGFGPPSSSAPGSAT
ncbi:phosphoribosyltransferase family protein [Streptomyces sp. NPDC048142]|uniref:phosphoribosyltransferase family protein n=1 Tax=Streptomyces sp. NPDC048142 TaxID=3365501 RepID=UPI0037180A1E